jgi:hypothetical protein
VGAATTQRVVLVGPGGQPLKIAGGRLDIGDGKGALTVNGTVHSVVTAPGAPFRFQQDLIANTSTPVLSSIAIGAHVEITSVTLTGTFTPGGPQVGGVSVFDGQGSSCTPGLGNSSEIITTLQVTAGDPTVEFTFPSTAPDAPIGLTPKSPWCIGVGSNNFHAFVSIYGTRT